MRNWMRNLVLIYPGNSEWAMPSKMAGHEKRCEEGFKRPTFWLSSTSRQRVLRSHGCMEISIQGRMIDPRGRFDTKSYEPWLAVFVGDCHAVVEGPHSVLKYDLSTVDAVSRLWLDSTTVEDNWLSLPTRMGALELRSRQTGSNS